MGCDIHFYVEKKVDGCWVSADVWAEGAGYSYVDYEKCFYQGRNYDLFAILADVRNGYGFAGVVTGAGFVPLCGPKGLPDDVSGNVRAAVDLYGVGGHSHSWLLLDELLRYDWTQVTTKCGVVTPEQWARWKQRGVPDEYCGAVMGGATSMYDEAEFSAAWEAVVAEKQLRSIAPVQLSMDKSLLESFVEKLGGGKPYTSVEWSVSYAYASGSFFTQTIPGLLKLAAGEYDKVRIVFFFDN